jgi:kynurenine formamidase
MRACLAAPLARALLAAGLLALLAACAPSPSETEAPAPGLRFAQMVDLSHTITQNMPHPPGVPRTEMVRAPDGETLAALTLGAGAGTSARLPVAATAQPSLEQRSPRELVAPAVVLDVRAQAQDNPAYRLRAADVRAWEEQHGPIPAGTLVLLATGWDVRWGTPGDYLNLDAQQVPQVPGLAADAVALLHERQIHGIGSDTPTLGAADLPGHWLLLVNLTSVEQLPPTGSTLVVGALRVQGSAAAPARVLAFIP